mgnify:CR=1 FL=1
MDSIMAKILIDVPDMYKHLLDYNLIFVNMIEEMDIERKPQLPVLVITMYRTEKRNEQNLQV